MKFTEMSVILLTATEIINTFKYIFVIMKAAAKAIKLKNRQIGKFKTIITKLSGGTFIVIATSFLIIFKDMFYSLLANSRTEGDVIVNAILSIILSTFITIISTVFYLFVLIILWIMYFIWKHCLKKEHIKETKQEKEKPKMKYKTAKYKEVKPEKNTTETNQNVPVIIDVDYTDI